MAILKSYKIRNTGLTAKYIYDSEKVGFIYSNLGFNDIDRVIQLFQNHNKLHETSIKAMHIIFAFPPEEILTDEKIKGVARELVSRLGMKNCPWVLATHVNRSPHFHLLLSRITWQGKLINRDWHVVRALMPLARELERDFNLIPNDLTRKSGDYRTSDEIFGFRKKFTNNEYIRIHASRALENSYDIDDFRMYCEEKEIFFKKSDKYDGLVYNVKGYYVSASSLGDKYKLDEVQKYIGDRAKRVRKMLLDVIEEELSIDKVRSSHWNELSFKMKERGIKMEVVSQERQNVLKLNFENNDYYFRSNQINQEVMRLLIQMLFRFQQENSHSTYEREESPASTSSRVNYRDNCHERNSENNISNPQELAENKKRSMNR